MKTFTLIQLAEVLHTEQNEFKRQLLTTIANVIQAELKNSSSNSADNLLTTGDVAKLLSVSKSHINILRKDPTFPVLKIGDAVRFEREKVLAYIKNNNRKGGEMQK